MTEKFLHYLWQFRLFQPELATTRGERVGVIHPGNYNPDGGPDFFNARLVIGGTTWAGNVEIHLRASDWYRHHHQDDPAYNNVILHVVDSFDADVYQTGDVPIPTVEVKNNYPASLLVRYERMILSKRWVPCEELLNRLDPDEFQLWAPSLVVERLMQQGKMILETFHHTGKNWAETFYQTVARAMGFNINAQPFQLLARSIPLKVLLRYKKNLQTLEAILFGQAGFLELSFQEAYPCQLQSAYRFYRNKHDLTSLQPGIWKFLRMRPNNFPTIRISQFAAMIHERDTIFYDEPQIFSVRNWLAMFHVKASIYWNTHYSFDRISASKTKLLGEESARLLVINAVAPYLFLFARNRNLPILREQVLEMMEAIPGEQNKIINTWQQLGMPVENAVLTQALKQLKATYCDRKRCLECRIGATLLK